MRNVIIISLCLLAAATASAQYRVGILGEQHHLQTALTEAGYAVEHLVYDDFLKASPLAERFDCIVFTDSPRFPYAGSAALTRYLKTGGDIVTLRGPCFSEPLYRCDGQWLNRQAYLDRSLSVGEDAHEGIDFRAVTPAQWSRDADNPASPSAVSLEDSAYGKRLRVAVKNFSRWDTFRGPFEGGPGHNALALGVQGDDGLNDIVVEIRERDGSRWVATVPVAPARQTVVVLDADFMFFADQSPADRGTRGDTLNLAEARMIQIGLSFDLSPKKPGRDYTFYIDTAETFRVDVPEGFAAPLFDVHLPLFYDAPQHRYTASRRLRTFAEQDLLQASIDTLMNISGLSAIGYPYVDYSAYIPLLEAVDSFDRRVGFVGGVLIHYAGDYAGGNWLIFGAEQDGFYETEVFTKSVIGTLEALQDGAYAGRLKKENRLARARVYERTSADIVPVHIDPDSGRFVYADGRPFFMVGVNYIGSFDVKCRHASEQFFLHKWEADFEKAHRAGINCFRLWIEGLDGRWERLDSILTLANRYGIYLLLMPTAHPLEHAEAITEMFAALAEQVADEPIVIGYDLMNEPYVNTIGSIRFGGQPGPLSQFGAYTRFAETGLYDPGWVNGAAGQGTGWPPVGAWVGVDEAKDLYAAYDILRRYASRYVAAQDYSSLHGLGEQMPIEPRILELIGSVNHTFDRWIAAVIAGIRQHDPNGSVTVGYNTILTALPANNRLDFVNHHLYQSPLSADSMAKALGVFEQLNRLWPNKPITLGEFGYSTGTKLLDGGLLDKHTAAMAEIMIYLYAYANGYDGAMSWMLTDWPVPLMDYNAPWIPKDRQVYEAGFGMYIYDGTATGRARPIVPTLKFFSDYLHTANRGSESFEMIETPTPLGYGYRYTNDDAVFVGAQSYSGDGVHMRSDVTTNFMMRWQAGKLVMVSSSDAHVTLDRDMLYDRTAGRTFEITGKIASLETTDASYSITLLAGEQITLRTQKERQPLYNKGQDL